MSCSACLEDAMDEEMAMELANVVVRIGRNGCLGNFRFAVAVNHIKPTPFFPCGKYLNRMLIPSFQQRTRDLLVHRT